MDLVPRAIGAPTRGGKVDGSNERDSGQSFATEHRHYAIPPNRVVSMNSTIQSERLDLITLTPAFLRAALDGNQSQAEMLMQLSLPRGWPVAKEPGWPDFRDVLALRLGQIEDEPAIQPWFLRAIVPRGSCVMVGHIGFHTAPEAEYLVLCQDMIFWCHCWLVQQWQELFRIKPETLALTKH